MTERDSVQGRVVDANAVDYRGRVIHCWTNPVQAAVAPQPLNLSDHIDRIVEVTGVLAGDLWEAELVRVVPEDGSEEFKGKVVDRNVIRVDGTRIRCYRQGMAEAWFMPLDLSAYLGRTITVAGERHGDSLYRAYIAKVPRKTRPGPKEKEAVSLEDLLKIRAANRNKIEAINGNLGTALGIKWTNNRPTEHPCVIIFVPQKVASFLVPEDQKAPEFLKGPGGKWCYTDVVTGGKAKPEEVEPPPPLSNENKTIVDDLKSGRLGLIGGIQLAVFEDGIQDSNHAIVGTAGIAVRHRSNDERGLLTNQHVADAVGRRVSHPWHNFFPIGRTRSTKLVARDENWYEGVIDESRSWVRCDCAFVGVDDWLSDLVRPGLHGIGDTGKLLRIDTNSMDIIGRKVISVGRTRGVQRGTIVAYSYEWYDDVDRVYTDLLIVREEGGAFSDKGDSGKVIVTDDDEHRPVALLWGGWQERLREGREQEKWSYAIDLGKVLDRLNLALLD